MSALKVQKLATLHDLAVFLQLEPKTVARPYWRKKLGIPEIRLNGKILRFDLEEVQKSLQHTVRKEVV